MTSRQFLTQVKRLHDLMEEEKSDLEDMQDDSESYSDISPNRKEAYMIRLKALQRIFDGHKAYYPRLQEKTRRKIYSLENPREKKVLVLRYIELYEWDQIPKKMNCSGDAAWGVHKRALKHLELILNTP